MSNGQFVQLPNCCLQVLDSIVYNNKTEWYNYCSGITNIAINLLLIALLVGVIVAIPVSP